MNECPNIFSKQKKTEYILKQIYLGENIQIYLNPSKKPSLVPSISFPSVPLPSPPLCHVFYIDFTSTEVPLFSNKYGSVIYGCDRIVEAFNFAPILGEISCLVCNLEDKTSQNDCFFTQMLKSDP